MGLGILSNVRGQAMANATKFAITERREFAKDATDANGLNLTPEQIRVAAQRRAEIERYIKETVREADANVAASAARFQRSLDTADAAIAAMDTEQKQ